jgi:hypothetical protein
MAYLPIQLGLTFAREIHWPQQPINLQTPYQLFIAVINLGCGQVN